MSKTKKTLRFYSKEEMSQIKAFAASKKIDKTLLQEFCKKYNRSFAGAQVLIYKTRKQMNMVKKGKRMQTNAKLRSSKDVINLTKGEFNIPIKSWNISQTEEGFFFNVKF